MLKQNDVLEIKGYKFTVLYVLDSKVCLGWTCSKTQVYKQAWISLKQTNIDILVKAA